MKYTVLEKYFHFKSFQGNQEEIIDSILSGKDTIAILKTGGGKSLCFQIPALIFQGLTIVISPLISLMIDQVTNLKKRKIKAACINASTESYESKNILRNLKDYKLLYISPERLENNEFIKAIKNVEISFIAIDECHCLEWGNDFRRSYLKIKPFIKTIPTKCVVAAFTATATLNVIDDIKSKLGLENAQIFTSSIYKENLFYSVICVSNKLKLLKKYLDKQETTIIYCLTIKEVEKLYKDLSLKYSVTIYHGKLQSNIKVHNQKMFMNDEKKIIIATNAFGMGIDKKDVRLVINYQMPQTLKDFMQTTGRCSRDGKKGECVLFYHPKDVEIVRYFANNISEDTPRKEARKIINGRLREMKEMVRFCKSKSCLHKQAALYFNETIPPCKQNCSNCIKKIRL